MSEWKSRPAQTPDRRRRVTRGDGSSENQKRRKWWVEWRPAKARAGARGRRRAWAGKGQRRREKRMEREYWFYSTGDGGLLLKPNRTKPNQTERNQKENRKERKGKIRKGPRKGGVKRGEEKRREERGVDSKWWAGLRFTYATTLNNIRVICIVKWMKTMSFSPKPWT